MVATTWFVLGKMVAIVFVVAAADMPSCVRLRTLVPAPSGRAAYEQRLVSSGLATTSSGEGWLDAGRLALRSTLEAPLPYVEVAAFDADRPAALAYLIQLQLGQRLEVQTELLTPSPTEVFLDIFDVDNADNAAASAPQGWRSLVYEPRQGGRYLLRVQPEALRDGRLRLRARSVAALTFPVAGFDSASVHSRFGAPRDGGRRDHHGIDIFAPRGTRALAAADGFISHVGTSNLGGKVVWLWDPVRNQSLYYAHLDTQDVSTAQRVRRGDVVGTVGNTGNARSTRPHLHFGIYRFGAGAVDPLPYVRNGAREPFLALTVDSVGVKRRVLKSQPTLHAAPSRTAPILERLRPGTVVEVEGRTTGWFRIELPDDTTGFVPADALRPMN